MPEVQNDFVWTVVGAPAGLLGVWLLLVNIVTFFAFGMDKLKARRKEKNEAIRRVPEKVLFLLAIIGGSIGALLGMKVWRHKTKHRSFQIGIPVILLMQVVVPLGIWMYWSSIS